MKKIYIILLVFLLVGCGAFEKVIDKSEYKDLSVEILSKKKDFGDKLHIKNKITEFTLDTKDLNPWKVDFANIDSGEMEIAIGVFKESPHHPEKVKRVFLYNIDFENKRLKPKIRISRLNNPLIDFIMLDIDNDRLDEIISIEKNKEGKFLLSGYKWGNFSIEKIYESKILEEKIEFSGKNGKIKLENEEKVIYLEGDEIVWKKED